MLTVLRTRTASYFRSKSVEALPIVQGQTPQDITNEQ